MKPLGETLPGVNHLYSHRNRLWHIGRQSGMDQFQALVVDTHPAFSVSIHKLRLEDLPAGDVVIQVAYSSVNYKDALATRADGQVVKKYPMVLGIDLAGVVVTSSTPKFHPGDEVLVTGYDLGIAHFGGFSEFARVPADWVIPLPHGMELLDAMRLGTAGLTAALAVDALESHHISSGPVLITGATGGVGSLALNILADRGYEVIANTRKAHAHAYLYDLGAKRVLLPIETGATATRALDHQQWAGAVDSVGGHLLEYLLRTTRYRGAIAACGMSGGTHLSTTVFPFILRGVSLLGIDSVLCPYNHRMRLWQRLASDLRPSQLSRVADRIVDLHDLPLILRRLLQGDNSGRVVVRCAP